MLASEVRAFDLFADLTEAEAQLLAEQAVTRRARREQVLFRQGEPAGCAVLLIAGQIKLEHALRDGTVTIVDILGPANVLFLGATQACPVEVVALGPVEYGPSSSTRTAAARHSICAIR